MAAPSPIGIGIAKRYRIVDGDDTGERRGDEGSVGRMPDQIGVVRRPRANGEGVAAQGARIRGGIAAPKPEIGEQRELDVAAADEAAQDRTRVSPDSARV